MRHPSQIFVIAKLNGRQYRSLAAVNQWTNWAEGLKVCHRLLHIFSENKNRFPIQQELTFAAEFFENASEADFQALAARNAVESDAPCPFPFITTCLIVGASYEPGTAVTAGIPNITKVDEEPFGVKYSTERNSYGIMVLDITDLGNVRYCFLGVRGMELDLDRKVPLHTPLDGWTYLRAFENDKDDSGENDSGADSSLKATAEGLEKFALVELSSLADCWPGKDWKAAVSEGDSNDGLADPGSSRMSMPSLRTLSQNKLFHELLSSDGPPDLSLLDLPMLFRGFTQEWQRYLIDNADALSKSPAAFEILEKAFAGVTSFDFAPFQGKLSTDTLVTLASSEAMRHVKTANFSRFDSITDMRLVATVLEHANIDTLYLLARPDRMSDSLSEMLKGLSGCSKHPLVRQRLVLGSAFSQGLRQSDFRPWIRFLAEPSFWKTFPVIQLLYSGPLEFNDWISGETAWLTSFFLGNTCLTPTRFVTGLLNIIKGRCKDPTKASDGILSGEREVPLTFACAPPSLKTLTTSTEISPIPANGVACSDWDMNSFGESVRVPVRDLQDLRPDVWTAVMVHTAIMDWDGFTVPEKTRFRVALVRSKGWAVSISELKDRDFELEVVDLKQFLELTAPEHVGDLEAALSELTAWAQTDDELVTKLGMDETISKLGEFAESTG